MTRGDLPMPGRSGLTVIELLLALAIIAILAASGAPALANLALEARMTAQINRLVHGVHLANRAAHQGLVSTALCKSQDGLQCSRAARWTDGWIVFVNDDGDQPPAIDAGERVLDIGRAFQSGAIVANRDAFIFAPFETRSTNGTLTFCDRRGAARARSVIVSYTGRPRVVAANTECDGT
jgi:type IV fimbrial biogenesis protein FimT